MLVAILLLVISFVVLIWAADRFVVGAVAVARIWDVSPLLIGLTIVALGTSAPEIVVSAIASFAGQPDLGVGNALGSNITNIGLVLGIAALCAPIAVKSDLLRREFPLLLFITAAVGLFFFDFFLTRIEGVVLFSGFILLIIWFVRQGLQDAKKRAGKDVLGEEYQDEIEAHVPSNVSLTMALIWLGVGLILLPLSARFLVGAAVDIAQALGVSELVIGLTIVAIGTSLPELASAVIGVLKKHDELALGSILGSNMFNSLAVLAMPALIAPSSLTQDVFYRDFAFVVAFTFVLFVMSYGFRGAIGRVSRWEGGVLLLGYIGYMILLYKQSVGVSGG